MNASLAALDPLDDPQYVRYVGFPMLHHPRVVTDSIFVPGTGFVLAKGNMSHIEHPMPIMTAPCVEFGAAMAFELASILQF